MSVDRALGMGAALAAIPVTAASWEYGIGSFRTPGAGFWPFCIGVAMFALGATLVARPIVDPAARDATGSRWRAFAIALLTLAFYVVALEPLGYFVATTILLVVQLRWVEARSWRGSVGVAVASAAISLVVFRTLLKVPLPLGILPLPRGW